MIQVDSTQYSTVVYCRACDWSVLAWTHLGGLERANEHERNVHPEHHTAEQTLSQAKRRHAAKHATAREMTE